MIEAAVNVLLEANRIGRRNPGSSAWLFRDISISLTGGCRLALHGPTGAGKTLLLRALARLDTIESGEILWRGEKILGDAVPKFRRQVIYLPQRATLFEGTVEDNLQYPFSLAAHANRRFCAETILSLLARVDRSASFLTRSVTDLSGGEAQIACLLRALQLSPSILMLDEPTASLDDETTRSIERLVRQWFEESAEARGYLWVSHDPCQVNRVADRVLRMANGRLCAAGRTRAEEGS